MCRDPIAGGLLWNSYIYLTQGENWHHHSVHYLCDTVLLGQEVIAAMEKTRSHKNVEMRPQGAWTKLENVLERKMT